MAATYDTIGVNYANLRKPDPRIEQIIWRALGDARTVVNVGAGAGSYEPPGRELTAVEPSSEMITQRSASAATLIQGAAEDLPFDDKSFDAAMAVLTVHHWTDKQAGLRELRRVSRGPAVILTYDPAFRDFWLLDYFPELVTLDEGQMPALGEYEAALGPVDITPVPIPHDCTDGFLAAYWRRPAAYLDERIRKAMSSFWAIGDVSAGLTALKHDLESGVWEERYGGVSGLAERDCGYRLVTTR